MGQGVDYWDIMGQGLRISEEAVIVEWQDLQELLKEHFSLTLFQLKKYS